MSSKFPEDLKNYYDQTTANSLKVPLAIATKLNDFVSEVVKKRMLVLGKYNSKNLSNFDITNKVFRDIYKATEKELLEVVKGEEGNVIEKANVDKNDGDNNDIPLKSKSESQATVAVTPARPLSSGIKKTPSSSAKECNHLNGYVYVIDIASSHLKVGTVKTRTVEERLLDFKTIVPQARILFSMIGCDCIEKKAHTLLQSYCKTDPKSVGHECFDVSLEIAIDCVLLAKKMVFFDYEKILSSSMEDCSFDMNSEF
jgi:hypothetical protein